MLRTFARRFYTTSLRPHITVLGVGGAGGNAVNNMIRSDLSGVKFMVANTDAQALETSLCDTTIQLGAAKTKGLGAGARPDVGKEAAEESLDEIMEHIKDTNMLFITAGMGGGTGTGAAPVIAKAAREADILTVGVITKPFNFEGRFRQKLAADGINELEDHLDTMIVIPNQNLLTFASTATTFADAFKQADSVLLNGVQSITDLIVKPGLINLDFADVRTVMKNAGRALMGTGVAEGAGRARAAAEASVTNPLLDQMLVREARGVLISISGGSDLTLFEVDEIANHVREQVHDDANIIFGSTFDDTLSGKIRVSVIVSGTELAETGQEQVKTVASPNGAKNGASSVNGVNGSGRSSSSEKSRVVPTVEPHRIQAPVRRDATEQPKRSWLSRNW